MWKMRVAEVVVMLCVEINSTFVARMLDRQIRGYTSVSDVQVVAVVVNGSMLKRRL